jgi:hypothetical protein
VQCRFSSWTAAVAVWCALVAATTSSAQELEPKAYSASPVGAAFLVAGLTASTGGVISDPTLPIQDADATVFAPVVTGGYTFGLFGKLALVTGTLPYVQGSMSGLVGEQAASITRSGVGDARARFSMNFRGNPAMRGLEFAKAPRRTIVGASVTVVGPTGQYDPAKLINIGTNRWAFKPEFGVAVPLGRWEIDGYVGVWLFTPNDTSFPGPARKTQDPIVATQGHVSYHFRPRLWIAVDSTQYLGGAIWVDGAEIAASMSNMRLGATLALPVGPRQSLKLAYSTGVFVRTGTDFRTFSVGWQWLWLTKL